MFLCFENLFFMTIFFYHLTCHNHHHHNKHTTLVSAVSTKSTSEERILLIGHENSKRSSSTKTNAIKATHSDIPYVTNPKSAKKAHHQKYKPTASPTRAPTSQNPTLAPVKFPWIEVSHATIKRIYKHFPKHPTIDKTASSSDAVFYQSIHPDIYKHTYKFANPSFQAVNPAYKNFTKVLVPAVYKEYERSGLPPWITDLEAQKKLGYSVFLYQKTDPAAPNYIRNRGTEAGVFLKYIVDHYDNFPDIAIFVHEVSYHYNPYWFEQIGCIKPNATYMNINFKEMYRSSDHYW